MTHNNHSTVLRLFKIGSYIYPVYDQYMFSPYQHDEMMDVKYQRQVWRSHNLNKSLSWNSSNRCYDVILCIMTSLYVVTESLVSLYLNGMLLWRRPAKCPVHMWQHCIFLGVSLHWTWMTLGYRWESIEFRKKALVSNTESISNLICVIGDKSSSAVLSFCLCVLTFALTNT